MDSSHCRTQERVYDETYSTGGLTKREYFAAQAMFGMCVGRKLSESPEAAIGRKAVKLANALIAALNEEKLKSEPPA